MVDRAQLDLEFVVFVSNLIFLTFVCVFIEYQLKIWVVCLMNLHEKYKDGVRLRTPLKTSNKIYYGCLAYLVGSRGASQLGGIF